MKTKTLKTKLKAKNIICLEQNGIDFPITYAKTINLLNENTKIEDLKISEAVQILEICETAGFENLDKIYDIFATTEAELKQKNTDLKTLIKTL
jgi:hypothetical protein